MRRKALIIGTGLGGLALALRLSKKGFQVSMVEKYHQAGGRLNRLEKDGFTFDLAPTFFSMSYEFKELFHSCGLDSPSLLTPLDPLYAVRFRGEEKPYNLYRHPHHLCEELTPLEENFEDHFKKYMEHTGSLFHDVIDRIVRRNHNSFPAYLKSLMSVPLCHMPLLTRSFWKELDHHFDSERVKQILSLCSFFLGGTPFNTPAVYTILSYTEFLHDGYHAVNGGMYRIVEELLKELKKEHVEITYNREIISCVSENNALTEVIDNEGHKWKADLFVANADAALFRGSVLNRKTFSQERLEKMNWTMAPFTIYLGIKGQVSNIETHNYFLGTNFRAYAHKVFSDQFTPDQPYYYVNVPSRLNPSAAPEGHEALFFLVPVPDLRHFRNWDNPEAFAESILKDFEDQTGFPLRQRRVSQTILPPPWWEKSFNLYKGSGLSLGHNLTQMAYFRPSNVDEKFKNLFYTGASTVPGTGLPMAIISSRLTEEQILKSYKTSMSG